MTNPVSDDQIQLSDTFLAAQPHLGFPTSELVSMLRRGAVEPKRILDAGCGFGHASCTLAGEYPEARVLGLDIEPLMVHAANARAKSAGVADRCLFNVMNLAKPNLPDSKFDLVVLLAVNQVFDGIGDTLMNFRPFLQPPRSHLIFDRSMLCPAEVKTDMLRESLQSEVTNTGGLIVDFSQRKEMFNREASIQHLRAQLSSSDSIARNTGLSQSTVESSLTSQLRSLYAHRDVAAVRYLALVEFDANNFD